MSNLPVISGEECLKLLMKIGYRFLRQKGSHVVVRKDEPFSQIVIPNHKVLDRGTLRGIIKQTGLSVEEFNKIIKT